MRLPKVTIAVPTFNRRGYLQQSLQSALSQSYANVEVIVSDNCSSDGTAEYLSSLKIDRLVVLRQASNLGMIGNWNACLEKATGEFFLLLSDDDLLEERAIENLVSAIVDSEIPEEVAFAYCRGYVIDHEGQALSIDPIAPRVEEARDFVLNFFLKNRELRPCATLLRTEDIKAIGGYTQGGVVFAVDAMVWSRILKRRRLVVFVAELSARYRVHQSNTSSVGRIRVWQDDLQSLAKIWVEDFRGASPNIQRRFRIAVRAHEAWMISVTINQSAKSYFGRFLLLKTYFDCRSSFAGLTGTKNLALGLLKLFVPELIKKPIRAFLIKDGR